MINCYILRYNESFQVRTVQITWNRNEYLFFLVCELKMIVIHSGEQKALVVKELNFLVYLLGGQRCSEMQIQLLSSDTSGCVVPRPTRTEGSAQLVKKPLVRA